MARCCEVAVVSPGRTVEVARANLTEALALFFACADERGVAERLDADDVATGVEAAI